MLARGALHPSFSARVPQLKSDQQAMLTLALACFAVCGCIQTKCTKLEGLQIGQLVSFKKEHIVEVQEDSDSDDDY